MKSRLLVSRLHIARSAAGVAACLLLGPFGHATDTYDGTHLAIPTMLVGSATYADVVLTVGRVISGPTAGPASGIADSYDPATGVLTVPAVVFGSRTYYNVTVTVSSLEAVGGISGADSYVSGQLTSPAVQVGGNQIHVSRSPSHPPTSFRLPVACPLPQSINSTPRPAGC